MEITINGLKKVVNENFTLDVPKASFPSGAICALAGDNGKGKTTLLRIIAGLDPEFNGQILYDGEPINKKIRMRMTMCFQTPMLLNRSVYHNIEYPMKLHKVAKHVREEKIDDFLNMLNLVNLKKKNATRLSGGESQKVALLRALAINPSLLMLDEPFSAIDAKSISEMEQCIVDYNKRTNATVILVSHNKEQINKLCNLEIVLE